MKTLWLLLSVLLFCTLPALAAVIETVEWTTKPGLPWTYSAGQSGAGAAVDAAPSGCGGSSPSGGSALKMIYPAGTYATSFGGGRAGRVLSPALNELYFGHWNCYSAGFVFHPTGQKMDFFILSGTFTNYACGFSYLALGCTNQITWGGGNVNHPCNMNGGCPLIRDTWFWVEWRVKMNTPGGSNGEFDLWINDVQKAHYTNLQLANVGEASTFGSLQHTAEYGGGGSNLAATQYWWIDHTVLSTTRIFCPVPSFCNSTADTVAPTTPTALTVN